jgi:hypothetical protein
MADEIFVKGLTADYGTHRTAREMSDEKRGIPSQEDTKVADERKADPT